MNKYLRDFDIFYFNFNIYLIEIMNNKLEVIIKYYNDISNLGVRLWKTTTALASFNLGEVLKIWFCDKNFKDLPLLDQSFIYTQYLETMLSKVAATGKYQDKNIDHSQWSNCFEAINNQDHFLYRYIAKAILLTNTLNVSSSYEAEFNIVKKSHLNFANYLNPLEQSLIRIEKATDKYNEDHKIASWLTEKSDLVATIQVK
ncbi:hypothetical protein [Rickettsia australis]|uniref:hypothetical protein n=1 Tax=Rickettsia australis TaxID=787 RepID=UPI00030DDDDF|nr:hypothetical protein [Rickettsia australis]